MITNLIAMNIDVDALREQRTNLLQMEHKNDPLGIDTIEAIVNVIDDMLDNHDRIGSPQGNDPGPLDTLALKHHGLLTVPEAEALLDNKEELPKPGEFEIEVPPLDAYMHEPGAKDDETKPMSALVLGGFSGALEEVVKVGTFGAEKYSPNGWMHVPNAHDRYANAAMRHWLTGMNGNRFNPDDGGVRHLAQVIWNLMAVLEFELAEEQVHQVESEFGEPTDGKSNCND